MLHNKIFIGFDISIPDDEVLSLINHIPLFEDIDETRIRKTNDYKMVIAKLTTDKSCSELHSIMITLKHNSIVLFANYTYQGSLWIGGETSDVQSYTNEFLVKVFDENDLSDLNEVVHRTKCYIKEQVMYMPQ